MLAILAIAEMVAGGLLESVIAWLGYLSGMRTRRARADTFFPRVILPVLTVLLPVLLIILVASEPPHPIDSSSEATIPAVFFGVALAVSVARVVVATRHYLARPREVPQAIQHQGKPPSR